MFHDPLAPLVGVPPPAVVEVVACATVRPLAPGELLAAVGTGDVGLPGPVLALPTALALPSLSLVPLTLLAPSLAILVLLAPATLVLTLSLAALVLLALVTPVLLALLAVLVVPARLLAAYAEVALATRVTLAGLAASLGAAPVRSVAGLRALFPLAGTLAPTAVVARLAPLALDVCLFAEALLAGLLSLVPLPALLATSPSTLASATSPSLLAPVGLPAGLALVLAAPRRLFGPVAGALSRSPLLAELLLPSGRFGVTTLWTVEGRLAPLVLSRRLPAPFPPVDRAGVRAGAAAAMDVPLAATFDALLAVALGPSTPGPAPLVLERAPAVVGDLPVLVAGSRALPPVALRPPAPPSPTAASAVVAALVLALLASVAVVVVVCHVVVLRSGLTERRG